MVFTETFLSNPDCVRTTELRKAAIVDAMILGSKIYDDNFQGLLPADEILSSSVGVNLSLVGEIFCQPGNVQSVVDPLRASTDCQVSGGVLVLTP